MNQFSDSIRRQIAIRFAIDAEGLADDAELFSSGLINSLGVMDLVTLVEQELGRAIEPSDITLENFDTIASIAAYAQRVMNGHR